MCVKNSKDQLESVYNHQYSKSNGIEYYSNKQCSILCSRTTSTDTYMETQAIYLSIDQAIHQCLKEHSKITLCQQFLIHLRSALETTRIRRIPNSRPLLGGWSPGGGRLPFLQQKTIQAVH